KENENLGSEQFLPEKKLVDEKSNKEETTVRTEDGERKDDIAMEDTQNLDSDE
ncbi:hypothetical protein A2U01_0076822, partial [Trifolium medium]|nr:hypothetical protein [Trifolium medium]